MAAFAARMKRLRRPLPRPRPVRPTSGKWVLFYDTTDTFREALDIEEACRPSEPNALCGGCTVCLMMQASRSRLRVERVDAEQEPRPCSWCQGKGSLVGFNDFKKYECETCSGLGAVTDYRVQD